MGSMIATTEVFLSDDPFESKLNRLQKIAEQYITADEAKTDKAKVLAVGEAREFLEYCKVGLDHWFSKLQLERTGQEPEVLKIQDGEYLPFDGGAYKNKMNALSKAIDAFEHDLEATGDVTKYQPMISRRSAQLSYLAGVQAYALKVGVPAISKEENLDYENKKSISMR